MLQSRSRVTRTGFGPRRAFVVDRQRDDTEGRDVHQAARECHHELPAETLAALRRVDGEIVDVALAVGMHLSGDVADNAVSFGADNHGQLVEQALDRRMGVGELGVVQRTNAFEVFLRREPELVGGSWPLVDRLPVDRQRVLHGRRLPARARSRALPSGRLRPRPSIRLRSRSRAVVRARRRRARVRTCPM